MLILNYLFSAHIKTNTYIFTYSVLKNDEHLCALIRNLTKSN